MTKSGYALLLTAVAVGAGIQSLQAEDSPKRVQSGETTTVIVRESTMPVPLAPAEQKPKRSFVTKFAAKLAGGLRQSANSLVALTEAVLGVESVAPAARQDAAEESRID